MIELYSKTIIPKELYFDQYLQDPEFRSKFCKHCLESPDKLREIREEFDENIRTVLKAEHPERQIETFEDFDGKIEDCWVMYDEEEENDQVVKVVEEV